MNILFYNLYHIGDTYFLQPFMKNIVMNNPEYKFSIYCDYNYSIFEDIPNLEIIKGINHNILDFMISNNNTPFSFLQNENLLLINTWAGIGALQKYGNHIPDSDLVGLNTFYFKCIDDINNTFQINLKYITKLELPKLPYIDTCNIKKFKNENIELNPNIKLLFYYNYLAMSGQNMPIKSMDDHDNIIIYLSKLNNYKILVPKLSDNLINYINNNNINNIIDCNIYFNLIEDKTCLNIYYYTYITNYCDIVIYYDSGRSFTYINDIFINNLKIHIATSNTYYNRLNINNILIPENYVKLLICHNTTDIINNLNILL